MRYYAGIGSRETPADIQEIMTQFGVVLESHGYILRSGGAEGADVAFEAGVESEDNKEIYLPWKGFNGSTSDLYLEAIHPLLRRHAYDMAKKFYHSNLDRAPENTKLYMIRNSFQVMGYHLDEPVEFLVCWTKDGKASGGTGQALRIAQHYNIPIFNFKNDISRTELTLKLLEILKREPR